MWLYLPPSILSAYARASEVSTSEFTPLSDGAAMLLEQSVMWRSKPSLARYWRTRWNKEIWMPRLFGRTLKLSQPGCTRATLTWLLEDIPASPSAWQDGDGGKKTPDTSGPTSAASSENCGLVSASSRTCADTSNSGSRTSGETFKDLVSRLSREYSQRLKSAQHTGGSDCSSWLTPHGMAGMDRNGKPGAGGEFAKQATQWATPQAHDIQERGNTMADHHHYPHDLSNAAGVWRTPSATEADHGGPNARDSKGGAHLSNQAQWATPAARDHKGANGAAHLENGTGRKHMNQLANQVAHGFPNSLPAPEIEPDGSESSQSGPTLRQPSQSTKKTGSASTGSPLPDESRLLKRRLNPAFVEWLMGFPAGWTDLGRLETPSYQRSQNTR